MNGQKTFTSEEMLHLTRKHLKENCEIMKKELTAKRKTFINNNELVYAFGYRKIK